MADLFTFENLGNLIMLCFLQAVLGFDNLLYISIESQRAPVAQQRQVRYWGIIIAVALRVVLLFTMIQLIDAMAEPFYIFNWPGVIEGGVNFATCVFILGGVFIIYTAVKEIGHMLSIEHLHTDVEHKSGKSAAQVVALIVLMNLIFSHLTRSICVGDYEGVSNFGHGNPFVWACYVGLGRWCDTVPREEQNVRSFRSVHFVDRWGCFAGRKRSGRGTRNA